MYGLPGGRGVGDFPGSRSRSPFGSVCCIECVPMGVQPDVQFGNRYTGILPYRR